MLCPSTTKKKFTFLLLNKIIRRKSNKGEEGDQEEEEGKEGISTGN